MNDILVLFILPLCGRMIIYSWHWTVYIGLSALIYESSRIEIIAMIYKNLLFKSVLGGENERR